MNLTKLILSISSVLILSACSTLDHAFAPTFHKTSLNNPAAYSAPAVTGKRKTGNPYEIMGKMYYPLKSSDGYRRKGIASWYGKDFHAKKTANGETYNMYDMTAAHPTLPIPTYVRVTNLDNGLSAVVRVNDRGPFLRGRVIDLSYKAAATLGMVNKGTSPVLLEALPTDGSRLNVKARFAKKHHNANENKNYKRYTSLPVARPSPKPKYRQKINYKNSFTNRISAKNTMDNPVVHEANLSAEEMVKIGSTKVYVQTGAFSNKQNAVREQINVAKYHLNTKLMTYSRGEKVFYRVRIGPIKDIDTADMVLANVIDNGWPSARIVVD